MRREVEARVRRRHRPRAIDHWHGGAIVGITPPDEGIRIVDRTAGLRRDGVQVIWKTRPGERRKHVIRQGKVLGVAPVVRDIEVPELRHAQEVVPDIPVCHKVESIHPATVHCPPRILPVVADVADHAVGCVPQVDPLTRGHHPGRRAVGAGKGAEVCIERAVLFDDEDDVLNLRAESLHLWRVRSGDGPGCAERREEPALAPAALPQAWPTRKGRSQRRARRTLQLSTHVRHSSACKSSVGS